MKPTETLMPSARTTELVVEELPGEILVYDLKRHRAHCLNRTSALVWRHCDGRTPVSEVAEVLEDEYEVPADAEIVWLALDRLRKAKLLDDGTELPAEEISHSRREMVQKLAVVGGLSILLPVVASIRSPLAAQAGSSTTNAQCNQCIGVGLPCSDRPGRICVARTGKQAGTCRCQ
jgi:hypothetical protein